MWKTCCTFLWPESRRKNCARISLCRTTQRNPNDQFGLKDLLRTPKLGYAKIQNIVYQSITKWTFLSDEVRKESVSKERVRIGQRIRELREAKGMDAKHLAFYADIDAANLCRIESGKYSVGLDILTKIGYALGMEIDFVEPKHQ